VEDIYQKIKELGLPEPANKFNFSLSGAHVGVSLLEVFLFK
jgi:hypothetical protein